MQLALMDTDGNIVESVPVSWNQVTELGLNLRPIERYLTAHYPESTTETTTRRRVA
jgi:hypothetical protein